MRPAQILNDARTRIVGIDVSAKKETTEKPCYFVTSGGLNTDLGTRLPVPDGQNVIMSMTQISVLCGPFANNCQALVPNP